MSRRRPVLPSRRRRRHSNAQILLLALTMAALLAFILLRGERFADRIALMLTSTTDEAIDAPLPERLGTPAAVPDTTPLPPPPDPDDRRAGALAWSALHHGAVALRLSHNRRASQPHPPPRVTPAAP